MIRSNDNKKLVPQRLSPFGWSGVSVYQNPNSDESSFVRDSRLGGQWNFTGDIIDRLGEIPRYRPPSLSTTFPGGTQVEVAVLETIDFRLVIIGKTIIPNW